MKTGGSFSTLLLAKSMPEPGRKAFASKVTDALLLRCQSVSMAQSE